MLWLSPAGLSPLIGASSESKSKMGGDTIIAPSRLVHPKFCSVQRLLLGGANFLYAGRTAFARKFFPTHLTIIMTYAGNRRRVAVVGIVRPEHRHAFERAYR